MTLIRAKSGYYEGEFRFAGFERLHLSLGIRWRVPEAPLPAGKREAARVQKEREEAAVARGALAQGRHDAIVKLFRQNRRDMLAQLRLPKGHPQKLTVERVAAMVEHHEPLAPIAAPAPTSREAAALSPWGTVEEVGTRYLAWLESHTRKSKGTHAAAGPQLRRFFAFVYEGQRVGDLPLEAVTWAIVKAYQDQLLAEDAAPNTITAYMTRVGALWNWQRKQEADRASEEQRTPRPLYSPVKSDETYRKTTRRDRFLEKEEADRLLVATPAPLLALVCLGLLAGLRRDEALFLRPQDVDLEARTIRIDEKQLPDGTLWTPKTKRASRVVPIADDLHPILVAHLASTWCSPAWVTPRPADAEWPWDERTWQNHFTAIVVNAGMIPGRKHPRGVTYHVLRHTFATHLASAGVDMKNLSELLGDTLQVTTDVYADLLPEAKMAAVAKLRGIFQIPCTADRGMTQETD